MGIHKLLPTEDIWRNKHLGVSWTELSAVWHCSVSTLRYHVYKMDDHIREVVGTEHLTIPETAKTYKVSEEIIKKIVET